MNPKNVQILYLSYGQPHNGCGVVNDTGVDTYFCKGELRFETARERWWYIAVSHCDNPKVSGGYSSLHSVNWIPSVTSPRLCMKTLNTAFYLCSAVPCVLIFGFIGHHLFGFCFVQTNPFRCIVAQLTTSFPDLTFQKHLVGPTHPGFFQSACLMFVFVSLMLCAVLPHLSFTLFHFCEIRDQCSSKFLSLHESHFQTASLQTNVVNLVLHFFDLRESVSQFALAKTI